MDIENLENYYKIFSEPENENGNKNLTEINSKSNLTEINSPEKFIRYSLIDSIYSYLFLYSASCKKKDEEKNKFKNLIEEMGMKDDTDPNDMVDVCRECEGFAEKTNLYYAWFGGTHSKEISEKLETEDDDDNESSENNKLVEAFIKMTDVNNVNNMIEFFSPTTYFSLCAFFLEGSDNILKNISDWYKGVLIGVFVFIFLVIYLILYNNKNAYQPCGAINLNSNFNKFLYIGFLFLILISLFLLFVVIVYIKYLVLSKWIYPYISFDITKGLWIMLAMIVVYIVISFLTSVGSASIMSYCVLPFLGYFIKKNKSDWKNKILKHLFPFKVSVLFLKTKTPLLFLGILCLVYIFISLLLEYTIGLFGNGTAKFFEELFLFIIFMILMTGIFAWIFLNLTSGAEAVYKILIGMIGIGCLFLTGFLFQTYVLVEKIMGGYCTKDDSKETDDLNKTFWEVIRDNFLIPLIPLAIIVMTLFIYPKDIWKQLDKYVFISVTVLYLLTAKYYPGFYGFVCSVFYIFLIFGQWGNIAGVLFGRGKSDKYKSCK